MVQIMAAKVAWPLFEGLGFRLADDLSMNRATASAAPHDIRTIYGPVRRLPLLISLCQSDRRSGVRFGCYVVSASYEMSVLRNGGATLCSDARVCQRCCRVLAVDYSRERKRLKALALGFTLLCALNLHYYAVLLFIPFWIAELVRTLSRRIFECQYGPH
jgi:hypothetical protein